MSSRSNAVKRRRTTCKTGCLTCKARKVKCDEGKPACHRCISTGRRCDGYGIWGGGGNGYAEPLGATASPFSRRSQHPLLLVSVPAPCYTSDEQLYLDWFYVRTVPKIPGMFPHGFWSTLLRQASMAEPAILHATLTLSSAHKTTRGEEDFTKRMKTPDEQDDFMLRNYSKAIRHLQPHLATKDRASLRIALIACAIFTCLEFLRGNFMTAQTHLTNGLRVLQESYGDEHNGVVILRATDATDQCIIETLQRLHVQVELLHLTHRRPTLILQPHQPPLTLPTTTFHSLKEAWTELNAILHQIVALRGTTPAHKVSPTHRTCTTSLIPLQQHLHTSLHNWHTTYLASKPLLDPQEPTLVINAIITNFYTLASILCATALASELAYDAHTPRFLAILENSIHIWNSRPLATTCDKAGFNMAHSIVDFGWVPPLYYTAIKCRVGRVRLHAVRLLEGTLHREGIWDCRILSRVMRRVMEVKVGLEDEMGESVVVEYRKAWSGAQWERVCVALTDPGYGCS
ncbi:hypothetical protein P171DRAFT_23850 [Karstenula rhodostoma CBS 690.94]|uniref:Zn(2)-C6 fungal-type domain-containing protein n=1 Tax=Karstenula rhodostoma CBS 690.94 TaxID=1392251 RepID=A0A9P4UA05_9PLEO|nr:hypothetical protein P171DRAFT_23850 [Karstenula rhodostoma CBS 690.94]